MDAFARQLAEQNYFVISMDLRGHGRWQSGADGTGKFVDYSASLKDLGKVCTAARIAHPHLPIYCIGESTGSALVVQAAARDQTLMDGAVLCSAGTRPRVFNVGWVLSDFVGNVWRIHRPVDLSKYIAKYASHDARVTEEMLTGSLDRSRMTGAEILQTVWFIARTQFVANRIGPNLPVLIVQGTHDGILEPRTAKRLLSSMKSTRKNLVQFPEYSSAITTWLDSQVQAVTTSAARAGG
jgi:alpha-beta hydrolase superfamily lysophospholipase